MPNRFGIIGPTPGPIRNIRKAIVGALIAGAGAAITAAQNANADGSAITIGALASAAAAGVAIWWTRNTAATDDE